MKKKLLVLTTASHYELWKPTLAQYLRLNQNPVAVVCLLLIKYDPTAPKHELFSIFKVIVQPCSQTPKMKQL